MKVKQLALLAVLGMALNIITEIARFLPFFQNNRVLFSLVSLIGCILVTVFFILFFITQQRNMELKKICLAGMIGQILYLISNILGTISIGLITAYMTDPIKIEKLVYAATITGNINFVITIASIILLAIFFIKLYKYLDNNLLKKASLFAFIGQIIVLISLLLNRILMYLITRILTGATGIRDTILGMNIVNGIIGIILIAAETFFFIALYRHQWNGEEIQQVNNV